ncbi:MAG: type II secretion system F family protein [Eubacteriales bacterium]
MKTIKKKIYSWKNNIGKRKQNNAYVRKTKKLFEALYVGKHVEIELQKFQKEKAKIMILIFIVGTALAVGVEVSSVTNTVIEDEKYILRETSNGDEQIIPMLVVIEEAIEDGGVYVNEVAVGDDNSEITEKEKYYEEVEIIVGEQILTDTQIEDLYQQVSNELDKIILGENENLENITKPLNLMTQIPEMPFIIAWSSSDYTLLETDGSLGNREPEEAGELVRLTATITYQEFMRELQFFVIRKPPILTKAEQVMVDIKTAIEEQEEKTKEKEYLELPTTVGDYVLVWKEDRSSDLGIIIGFTIMAMIAVFWAKDQELKNNVIKREETLAREYADFVSKLTLFLGAGMTTRGAVLRIGNEYKLQKYKRSNESVIYEEILVICNQLNTGISEKQAYDYLGKRCHIPSYRKLSSLLIQNLQKGSTGLFRILHEESQNALEERRNLVKKKGEEAGTKLLGPMMMMLGIVMVLIIIPAYMSFSI